MGSVREYDGFTRVLIGCGLGLGLIGCKNPPPTLQEIGERMDSAAQKVVEAAHEVIGKPRALPPAEEDEEPALERAREAYEAGKVAYQTARYIEAVEKFQESFEHSAKISDAAIMAQVQSSLYYNLGQAQLRAYDLDGDPTRLRQSRDLLRNHLDSDPGLSEEEREQALALIAEAEDELAELEGPAEGGAEDDGGSEDGAT